MKPKRFPVEADQVPLPQTLVEDEIRHLTYEVGRGSIRRLDTLETHIRSLVHLSETRLRQQLNVASEERQQ